MAVKKAAQRSGKKNFIDFILDIQSSEELLKGFITAKSAGSLTKFFVKKGYTVSEADSKKLIQAKKKYGLSEWPLPPFY